MEAVRYALRNAVFYYHRILNDTLERLREDLVEILGPCENAPRDGQHFEIDVSDGRKLVLTCAASLSEEQVDGMREILFGLGDAAGRATMIEEQVGAEHKLYFVGPSDTAIGTLRRAFLEPGWRDFNKAARRLFRDYPDLSSFRLDLVTSGRDESLSMGHIEWQGEAGDGVGAEALLDALFEDGNDIDLRLVDGRSFRRGDAGPRAGLAAEAGPDRVTEGPGRIPGAERAPGSSLPAA